MQNENGVATMSQSAEIIQKLVIDGDLSKMTAQQKVAYYNQFCKSLGLNPLTQPFQLIKFQGKERLYAAKDCTEQLRKIHSVSITDITTELLNDIFIVTAKAKDKNGKTDASTGVVSVAGLAGDALANALMKAETKAKRRVTLSICGLGVLDESEIETMKGATTEDISHEVVKPPVMPKTQPPPVPQSGDGNKTEKITPAGQGQKPWLNPNTKEWNNAFAKIHSGQIDMNDVLANYRISKDNHKNMLNPNYKYEGTNYEQFQQKTYGNVLPKA